MALSPFEQDRLRLAAFAGLERLHHAAFDNGILGISPDYVVHIDGKVLAEVDGPMLKHGIQEMEGTRLTLPRKPSEWPSRDSLARRFEEFAG